MASTDKWLEQVLMRAGNNLLEPPRFVDEILSLLDKVEHYLAKVEQSPAKSMQSALAPSLKALVSDKLFRHSNIDVKVAVASCISEITRITAPDAPYDDDQMKDVFRLIVSSFENLEDNNSRSYAKRASILETVARVRSCVVMLDLECDELIIEMFQHFLKSIRHYHPENVFSSMEIIMALVLEESEDISPELLSPLLDSVKKGNEEIQPVAKKLGEKVLQSCATKVKPYLIQAVRTLGISVDNYSDIVASICQETSDAVEQNDVNAADENKVEESKPVVGASSDEAAQASKDTSAEAASPKQADPSDEKSSKPVVNNGVAQTGEDDTLIDANSVKKREDGTLTDQSKSIDISDKEEPDVLDANKVVNMESKSVPEQTIKKRGRKLNSSIKSTEVSENSHIDTEKEAEKLSDDIIHSKDFPSSSHEDASVAVTVSSANQQEAGSRPPSPKAVEGESTTVASSSVSGSLPDESLSKKTGRPRKKENLIKDAAPVATDLPKKASEGTSDSEAKPHKRSGRKRSAGVSGEDKTRTIIDASRKESLTTSEADGKSPKKSSKKVDANNRNEDEPLSKQSEDKRQSSRGRVIPERNVSESSTKDDEKEEVSSPKSASKSTKDELYAEVTPKKNTKRKRALGKEKATGIEDDGEDLVGNTIKVWWPMDRAFYEGVVDSYDSVKKKHKVLYNDGDEELLNLKKERWEITGGDSQLDEGKAADHPSPDSSSEMPLKKKLKTNPDKSTKQGKMDAPPTQGGGASSSKSRNATTKSGRKLKEGRSDGKSMGESKAVKKTEGDNGSKTKNNTPKSGSKSANVSKSAGKSQNDDVRMSKASKSKKDGTSTPRTSKSKQDKPKASKSKQDASKVTTSDAKGKSAKSVGKTNAKGTGKLKAGSPKVKETEDKENSIDSDKMQESSKAKSASSSKVQGSEVKSGKKRRRGT